MELTLEELFKGKDTLIKGDRYLSAEAYVSPFIERMSKYTDDFRIQARVPDQISLTKQGEHNIEDTVYNRVWVQAVMPEECGFCNHQEVIGMIYALDARKPVIKIYKGALNMACLNLCIFSPSFLDVRELEPGMPINYKPITDLIERDSNIAKWLETLKNTEVPYSRTIIDENLGLWVRNALNKSYDTGYGKVKLATSTAIDAYKLLYEDNKSPYFVKQGDSTDMFNVYNAFTEIITNDGNKETKHIAKDIITKPEKTLLLKSILE